jgi:hypothetical protein
MNWYVDSLATEQMLSYLTPALSNLSFLSDMFAFLKYVYRSRMLNIFVLKLVINCLKT